MQISCPYIVWNNFPKFQENRARSFRDMRQSTCVIVVGDTTIGGVAHKLDRYPSGKIRKSQGNSDTLKWFRKITY